MGFSTLISKVAGQPENYIQKSNYEFGKTLGAGTFGIVKQARDKSKNEQVAVKIILKKTLQGNVQMVLDELHLLQQLKHPNIVAFKNWFESKTKFYIVTQLATGGELFDRICDKGKFTERDAAKTVQEVLSALVYLHEEKDVVHRDLKPENLLYLTPAEDSSLVLADFGIAKALSSPSEKLTSMAGSFGYAAPEILLGTGHGKPCDIWSLGVITYTLLSGYSPFRSETIEDFLEETQRKEGFLVFHQRYWKSISPEARDFISQCLSLDPAKRPTALTLSKHRWLADVEDVANNTEDLLPNIREGFDARQKLRKGIEAVLLANRIAALKMDDDDDSDSDEESEGAGIASFRQVVMAASRNKDLLKKTSSEST